MAFFFSFTSERDNRICCNIAHIISVAEGHDEATHAKKTVVTLANQSWFYAKETVPYFESVLAQAMQSQITAPQP